MSRIRSIKPEVHLDEELWDLEQQSGLPLFRAFTALWGQADREGRFEWRPRKLKAQCLPFWDGDFSRVLDALTTRAFLVRYACGGREYGLVRTFTKHQVINNREAASTLPAPPCDHNDPATLTRAPRVGDACPTPLVHALAEGKGREGKGREQEGSDASGTRDGGPNITDLAAAFSASRKAAGGATFRLQLSEYRSAEGVVAVMAEQPDPAAAMAAMLRNFFAADWTRARGWTWRDFAGSDPGRWLVAAKSGKHAIAPRAEDYTDEEWGVTPGGANG